MIKNVELHESVSDMIDKYETDYFARYWIDIAIAATINSNNEEIAVLKEIKQIANKNDKTKISMLINRLEREDRCDKIRPKNNKKVAKRLIVSHRCCCFYCFYENQHAYDCRSCYNCSYGSNFQPRPKKAK